MLLPQGEPGKISKHAKKIFLAAKPAPTIESKLGSRESFQLGSLSHFINCRAAGYQVRFENVFLFFWLIDDWLQDLPGFPAVPPDASVRTVEVPKPAENPWREARSAVTFSLFTNIYHCSCNREKEGKKSKPVKTKQAKFYDSDEDHDKANGGGDESVDSSPDSSSSESDSSSSSESEAEVAPAVAPQKVETRKKAAVKPAAKTATTRSKPKAKPASGTSSSSSSEDDDDDTKTSAVANPAKPSTASNLSLLLDLEEMPPSMPTPTLTPSLGGLLSPTPSSNVATSLGQAMFVPTEKKELLNKLVTGGVQVDARFTRHAHIYSPTMVSIELTFENLGSEEVGEIKLGARSLAPGMTVHEFPALLTLQQSERRNATLGVDFNDTTQAARVDLVIGGRAHTVNLACPTGEMLRPLVMPAITFADEQVFIIFLSFQNFWLP